MIKSRVFAGQRSCLAFAGLILLVAATAHALDADRKCLAGRAKAAGKYQQCMHKWMGACYVTGGVCDAAKLSKCYSKLAGTWAKLIKINDGICMGSRWVDNGDGTVTDRLTDLTWEQKTDDASIHDKDN